MDKRIDALFQAWQQGLCPGGQVLVVQSGRVIFEKNYGYANLETQTPMTAESVFHVASLTKPFTAMSIMILQERGLLNIHDDVRKYIPDLIGFSEPLTLKQMMNMVSGIRGYYETMYLQGRSHEDHYAQHEIRRIVGRQTKLNFTPGSEFVYTNANYMLLATIVERLSGQSFNEFATENIFKPLGMDHSFIRDDPHRLIPNKANSYHDDGYNFTNAILTFGIYGGTSLHTTCRDVVKFLDQYRQPTLISRETLETVALDFPVINGKQSHYGGGIMTELLGEHRIYHHGGVNAGYRTIGMICPEKELIVAIFANCYNVPVIPAAREILRILLGLPATEQNWLEADATDTVSLEGLGGLYYDAKKLAGFQVEVRDGRVYLDGYYMAPMGGNRFRHGRRQVCIAIQDADHVVTKHGPVIDRLTRLPETVIGDQAEQCPGAYYCDDAQSHFEIAVREGKLYICHLRHGEHLLYRLDGDQFVYDKYRIKFRRNENGQVDGFYFSSLHLRNVEFKKIS